MSDTLVLPQRRGDPPAVKGPRPHAQTSQNAPRAMQKALVKRALSLPMVSEAESWVSVPGARAFVLAEAAALGPDSAFQAGREFAHIHPEDDGSLHMTLPEAVAHEAFAKGWGEPHPKSGTPLIYGPRDADELETVWRLLQASHRFASTAPGE